MPMHAIFRLKNHALLMALAAAYPVLAHSAGAAKVDFAAGSVTAVGAAGAPRALAKGAEIGSGDAVVTGDGGRAQLRFTDGSMVSLQPGSEFKVDDYQFSGTPDGGEKGFFSLLKGGLRTITGLVGRTNKSAYKVTTSVATIGIRGTEFTIAYTGANSIAVSTGEGMIEVCNNAGCAIVPAGSSAIVSGPNTEVKRSEVKPRLDPAQPVAEAQPVYATSADRQESGLIAPVSAPLAAGSGNYVVHVGMKNGATTSPTIATSNTAATFNENSVLTSFQGGGDAYAATSIAGGFSMDGVLGWGRWQSGTYNSSTPLTDYHYAVGVPTPSAEISAISGTFTYLLAGYTTPTTTNGLTGSAPSATLSASFSGGLVSASMDLSVAVAGVTYTGNYTGSNFAAGSAGLSLSAPCGACGSCSAYGFLAGSNASHAGMTYTLQTTGSEYVNGALAFKR
ncbi:MAG TPA: FecR family protein [Azospira sp.]|nr:FecR family protein [Azospira sp.]